MYVYIVIDLDDSNTSGDITGVFLDPLNAEAYKIQYGYAKVEKHPVADNEQIRQRLKTAGASNSSKNGGPCRQSNPPPS